MRPHLGLWEMAGVPQPLCPSASLPESPLHADATLEG